jgi:putative ABC transport system ATP-binding protein
MSGSSDVLVAEGVVRHYDERLVIDHVSLTIAPGEMVSLMGESGCGKTTLLHILGTLDRPDGGRVLLRGRDPASLSDTARAAMRREELGFVFQQSNLLPSLTARENVALPAWRATGQRGVSLARADALLDRFGLAARANAPGEVLSLGEAQRVAVARALINQPPMVLADEPTGSLDSGASLEVLDAMAEVCRTGAALLIVTHDPNVAARCARRFVMRDGRLAPDALLSAVGGTSAVSAG